MRYQNLCEIISKSVSDKFSTKRKWWPFAENSAFHIYIFLKWEMRQSLNILIGRFQCMRLSHAARCQPSCKTGCFIIDLHVCNVCPAGGESRAITTQMAHNESRIIMQTPLLLTLSDRSFFQSRGQIAPGPA